MELTSDPDASLRWSEPRAAYDRYRPGLSPYLHYFHDLRASRNQAPPRADHGPDDGADVPEQLEQALRDLIDQSFR
ncbi:hypothetical protein [Paracoccus benzoatiresistens]|jgi:hypothetical protein|uniref:Uncharacterized protein n=1 Tax=Paracoccus benzoatiresistens TaxID=2997341 RepID=A0ABT4J2Q0_9RHOB|nr:hypothetical protein [Paracoccus sp. EF6]MCZ0961378.1 hypothetical protein [Paracoccus sp. EF6]